MFIPSSIFPTSFPKTLLCQVVRFYHPRIDNSLPPSDCHPDIKTRPSSTQMLLSLWFEASSHPSPDQPPLARRAGKGVKGPPRGSAFGDCHDSPCEERVRGGVSL